MIKIQAIKTIGDEMHVAFFTIDGQEYTCGNIPIELDTKANILAHLEKIEDKFILLILRQQYPESDHLRFQKDDMTELQSMQKWITAGHRNKIQIGLTTTGKPKYGYKMIEKQELEYRHPKWIGLVAKIEGANITPELKDLLKEIVK